VLGLALALEGRRLRFYSGAAPLPESAELVRSLERMMDDITQRKEDAERAREESDRAREESDRAREEAERTRDKLAAKLRELGIDPDKL
jgi:septal ring factor EnvC (AmiA/AmiB activator)